MMCEWVVAVSCSDFWEKNITERIAMKPRDFFKFNEEFFSLFHAKALQAREI